MHAVVVRVTVNNFDEAVRELRERVVPAVAQAPGFVNGYWFAPEGNEGLSFVLFESEGAAHGAAGRIEPPKDVTIDSVEVREVIAHA